MRHILLSCLLLALASCGSDDSSSCTEKTEMDDLVLMLPSCQPHPILPGTRAQAAPSIDNFLGHQRRTEPTSIRTFLGDKPADRAPALNGKKDQPFATTAAFKKAFK